MARRRLRTGRSHCTTWSPATDLPFVVCASTEAESWDDVRLAERRERDFVGGDTGCGNGGGSDGGGLATCFVARTTLPSAFGIGSVIPRRDVRTSPRRSVVSPLLACARRSHATPSSRGSRTTSAKTPHCSTDITHFLPSMPTVSSSSSRQGCVSLTGAHLLVRHCLELRWLRAWRSRPGCSSSGSNP
jgi:hypothetical protein